MRFLLVVVLVLGWVRSAPARDPQLWLSPLVSTMQADGGVRDEAALNSYVRASPDAGLGTVTAFSPRGPTGHPLLPWAFVATCAQGITADASNILLPVKNLDDAIGLTTPALTVLKAVLSTRGMNGSSLTATSTLREVAAIVLAKLGNHPPAHLTYRGGACP